MRRVQPDKHVIAVDAAVREPRHKEDAVVGGEILAADCNGALSARGACLMLVIRNRPAHDKDAGEGVKMSRLAAILERRAEA
jgi:hypothetical protein